MAKKTFAKNNYSITLHKMKVNKKTQDKFDKFKKILNDFEINETSNNRKLFIIEDFWCRLKEEICIMPI